MTLLLILAILLLFGVTVFVHELGHYLAARSCGLVVETFSIGFGPALVKWRRNGTCYKIGAIPFGGYVALPQLDPSGMEKVQGGEAASARTLPEVSPWKKIVVALCGPLGNVLLAILLAWVIYGLPGDPSGGEAGVIVGQVEESSEAGQAGLRPGDRILSLGAKPVRSWYDLSVEALLQTPVGGRFALQVQSDDGVVRSLQLALNNPESGEPLIDGVLPAIPCMLGRVQPGSAAEVAGIQAGDIVRSFNGVPVVDWVHFTELVQQTADQTVPVTVERGDVLLELRVTPLYSAEYDKAMIGVELGGGAAMPWMLHKKPGAQLKNDALAIFRILKALVTPNESRKAAGGLGGPVAIFAMLFASLQTGLLNTLGLIRFLNVNLAVLNLLPLPVLDGGHIVFALWEGITRRKVHPKVVAALVNGFAVLLIGAMLLLTMRDVDRLWNLRNAFRKDAPAAEEAATE